MSASRLALVVATDEYADAALGQLRSPSHDAEALARALGDPELGDFQVDVLHNRESHEIELRLEELLAERRPDDSVVIHFSCHGLKDDSGDLYLAARNTLPNRLGATAIDAGFVNRLVRRSRAGQVVLFLDCCYGGAFEHGMVPRTAGDVDVGARFPQDELVAGRGRAVITASSSMEYAFEGSALVGSSDVPPSVFTHALTEGLLTGDADRDNDGRVSLGELYDYIYDRVRTVSPRQTPGKWEFGTQGQFVVARNPRRKIVPADLPPQLLELAAHPYPATRRGIVEELRGLAMGSNLALAAAAREQLVTMTEDDSRAVSTEATEAVEAASVSLSTDAVEFGDVAPGTSATRVIEIRGAPLVEVSRTRVEGSGVTIRRTDRDVEVILDSTVPRQVVASLLVEGPAGSCVIPVTGQVTGMQRARERRPRQEEDARATARTTVTTPSEEPPIATTSVSARTPEGEEPAAGSGQDRGDRIALVVAALGAAVSLASLWLPWDAAGYGPAKYVTLLSANAVFWLVPPILVLVTASLSFLRGPDAVTTGLLLGAGLAMPLHLVEFVASYGVATYDAPALEAAFMIPIAAAVAVVVCCFLVARHVLVEQGERVRHEHAVLLAAGLGVMEIVLVVVALSRDVSAYYWVPGAIGIGITSLLAAVALLRRMTLRARHLALVALVTTTVIQACVGLQLNLWMLASDLPVDPQSWLEVVALGVVAAVVVAGLRARAADAEAAALPTLDEGSGP